MNKTKIKNFSIWARRNLIEVVAYRMRFLGIDENGIAPEMEGSTDKLKLYDMGTSKPAEVADKDISKRIRLANHIREHEKTSDYKTAYETVVEEIAYTWFNRLIAIRFMEVNDYLPSGVRVLSSESGKREPDIVTNAVEVAEAEGFSISKDDIWKLKDENKLDELFRILFIQQCKKLHEVLPELFDNSQDDYTELLLPISFIDDDAFICHLVTDIDEDDFNVIDFDENTGKPKGQVEIIGWLYQYYNSEKKDAVFAAMSNKVKVSKENIAAATQLFTPDWIVRYMVENSLGRLWVDGHADTSARSEWKYYLDEAEQTPEVQAQLAEIRAGRKDLTPEQIRFIDPCMGSGHILVYAFDVLMQIYLSCGYTERDAAQNIVRNNLWGLDLDKRAYQLAYFAVMMKARQYDRRFLGRGIKPNLSHFQDLPIVNYSLLDEPIKSFVEQFENAETYGSLISVENECPYEIDNDEIVNVDDYSSLWINASQLKHYKVLFDILSQTYDVVCTNPPYMGIGNMCAELVDFQKKMYPNSKSDLSTAFMEKCALLTSNAGYYSMINIPVWMFIGSYEDLRKIILNNHTIQNMVHFGRGVFGSDFGTVAFVVSKNKTPNYLAVYRRLFEKQGAVDSIEQKEKWFFEDKGVYIAYQENYSKIPGSALAYWISDKFFKTFINKSVGYYSESKAGIVTGNDPFFVRFWYEPSYVRLSFNNYEYTDYPQYVPLQKGGTYRRHYGNNWYVVKLHDLYDDQKVNVSVRRGDKEFYFKKGIGWSQIGSSEQKSFRIINDSVCGTATPTIYLKNDTLFNYILAMLNSKYAEIAINTSNPTLNLLTTNVCSVPVIINDYYLEKVNYLEEQNIELCKIDWDSFETSWDFKKHPFIRGCATIQEAYEQWAQECDERFNKLKANEEELNRIFIEIYGLQDELTPEVEDKDITVRAADLQRDMRSFVSYAVGCMFGRYSLDTEGLAYAGGEWDESKYKSFIPDKDNCLPITEEHFFEDDIVTQFANFVQAVFGEDTLEDNLRYVAENLGIKGNGTAREKIRQYFLKEFYKDHCKVYQKRPIYWLFDTGKKNGFKALCYIHRWTVNTVGDVRIDYMHKLQRLYRNEIIRLQEKIDNGEEIAKSQKRLEKITNQLKETEDYDAKIGMVVAARTEIDLDDGVKVNYDKVQFGSDGKKYQILATI